MTTPTTVNVQFQLRADTAANWTAANPILLANEFALETDTKKLKVGDGTTAWASLAYFPSIVTGGTVLGNLEIGSTGTLTFEGSTANDFETTLAVTDPTADRTITLPDQSGTVIVSGNASIVDADIAAGAEIAVSKLANGTANQVLVTDGTDVSWSDDLTLAGNLTVNGTTTTVNTQTLVVEDKNIELGVVDTPTDTTADGGGITLKGTTDKTINWVDSTDSWTSSENIELASGKSYRINDTEVLSATTLGSGVTSSSLTSVGTITSGTWQGSAIGASYLDSTVVTTGDTGTVTSTMIADGTIVNADVSASAAIAHSKLANITAGYALIGNATNVPTATEVTGDVTISDTGVTAISSGVIVNADVSASAAIAGSKVSPDFGNQTITTSGVISAAAGTAAAPSIAFTGDLNTGIYSPGADQLALSTSGAGRLFVDASGNVGVGVGSPLGRLHIEDDSTGVAPYFLYLKNNGTGNGTGSTIFFRNLVGTAFTDCAISGFGTTANNSALTFSTEGGSGLSERLRITSAGLVGIGTTSPTGSLSFANTAGTAGDPNKIVLYAASSGTVPAYGLGVSSSAFDYVSAGSHVFYFRSGTTSTEKARIDSTGRLLVGTSSSASTGDSQYAKLQVRGNTFSSSSFGIINLQREESATAITADEQIGRLIFSDNAGGQFAWIDATADSNAGTGDYPGRLVFSTTADGASSPTERMRISSAGQTSINAESVTPLVVDRLTSDGTVVLIRQGGITEGNISVSGTTVSYNGAHLSRWSQLPSGAERFEIPRGTVLSNIDEMCEWGDEDNEQLNRMKVSDVEGDKNVAGVFQAWDDDDDTYTNDFYCAMTGDFIIRIAAGVTVERGDLLMSAGDGTAKPQDDDIIRSKTIAKVTSTNVSCTHPDGSYCVPCVLMAC